MTTLKRALGSGLLAASLLAQACGPTPSDLELIQSPVVFGTDNRVEFASLTDPNLIRFANATPAVFDSTDVSCAGSTCTLALEPFTKARTPGNLGEGAPLCPGTRFAGQLKGALCSAILVAPDTVVTAGHCVTVKNTSPGPCDSTRKVVFGFKADSAGVSPSSVPSSDVYTCIGTPQAVYSDTEDYAVIKVDRAIEGRLPLVPRYSGPVQATELAAFGYGDGLPLKFARQAFVKVDDPTDTRFSASADVFRGNSGGPLVNLATGLVEGLASLGPESYLDDTGGIGCAELRVCDETSGCSGAFPRYTRLPYLAQLGKLPLNSAILISIL